MQKTWQAWTLADFGPERSVQDGRAEGVGGRCGCACVGFGANRASVFCPWRPLEVIKP